MPLVAVTNLVGPANVLDNPANDVEETINFFAELAAPGTGKTPGYLKGTPGLSTWMVLSDSPVRQLFAQDGRAFAVAGSSFYELHSNQTATFYGAVTLDTEHPPTIVSNGSAGNQLLITSGGDGYTFNLQTNTLAAISDPDFPSTFAYQSEFMDGYGLVNVTNTRKFQWSALEDFTSWDALDIAERSEASDILVAIVRNHRELWLLGALTSEVWYDQGDVFNPFAPIQGVFLEQGCGAQFTAQRVDNTIMWVGANRDGYGMVWKANGYTPERVSTTAVERDIQVAGFVGARAWVYQEQGHLFYVLLLPAAQWAWVYDVATGMWHKRATWDSTHCVWLPPRAQCHCFAFLQHLVGDRTSGAIYNQSLSIFTETRVN